MTQRLLLLAALAPALLAGGCMGTQNRGLESVHQPVVSRADYILDLNATPTGLAPGETQRLATWVDTMRLGYGDRITVDDPSGGRGPRDAVAAVISRRGLLIGAEAPVTDAPVAPGTVRVVVTRMRASVPGCPDWSRDAGSEFNSNTSSNQGCAVNSNLAAMVANPADLVRGQSSGGMADPMSNYRAIDAYRKATPTGGGGTTVKTESAGGK